MLLFRSLTIGLIAACLCLLVSRESPQPRAPVSPPSTLAPVASNVTVLDVSSLVTPTVLAALVRIAPGEHVVMIDDRPVSDDLEAGAAIAGRAPQSGSFLDLTIAGDHGARRVLVLMH